MIQSHRHIHQARRSLGLALLAFTICPAVVATTIHLKPNGNDAWSGRLAAPSADRADGPKATLAGAQAAVRTLKAKGPLTEAVHIKIAPGLYSLPGPVTFTPAESSTPRFPVVYEAVSHEHPIFSGGRTNGASDPVPAGSGRRGLPRSQAANGCGVTSC